MKKERGSISLRTLIGLAIVLAGLVVLIVRHSTAQGQVSDEIVTTAPAVVAAPPAEATVLPPVSSPRTLDAARQARLTHDAARVAPLLGEWSTAANLAKATPPEGLQPRIEELQDIRQRFAAVPLSEQCAVNAQRANGDAMDAHITYFIAVMNQWPTVPERREQAEQATSLAKAASADCHA